MASRCVGAGTNTEQHRGRCHHRRLPSLTSSCRCAASCTCPHPLTLLPGPAINTCQGLNFEPAAFLADAPAPEEGAPEPGDFLRGDEEQAAEAEQPLPDSPIIEPPGGHTLGRLQAGPLRALQVRPRLPGLPRCIAQGWPVCWACRAPPHSALPWPPRLQRLRRAQSWRQYLPLRTSLRRPRRLRLRPRRRRHRGSQVRQGWAGALAAITDWHRCLTAPQPGAFACCSEAWQFAVLQKRLLPRPSPRRRLQSPRRLPPSRSPLPTRRSQSRLLLQSRSRR